MQSKTQTALKRLDDVQEMFEKRHASLKKLSAKQARPVQPVAPRPESSPKRTSPKIPHSTPPGEFKRNQVYVDRLHHQRLVVFVFLTTLFFPSFFSRSVFSFQVDKLSV